jgi:hypothetical protein
LSENYFGFAGIRNSKQEKTSLFIIAKKLNKRQLLQTFSDTAKAAVKS